MPADSTTLEEEGVVIAPRVLDDAAIDELAGADAPARQRRADLRAQLAANRDGRARLGELAERVGSGTLREATAAVLDYAERRTRACLRSCPTGRRTRDRRARGARRRPRAAPARHGRRRPAGPRLRRQRAQHAGNLNCPLAVTRSACLFAVRVLTDPDIPPSAGAYRPVEVRAPEGCAAQRAPPAAVGGGNVETSSRVADLVLGAFGRALGQGTMNNLTLGNERFTYYETLGGGQGACPDADGPSGVHVAMSNTLNTPVEALELEFPLRVVGTPCAAARGGDGPTAAATASCAKSRRSRR
jgi:N-methylhydantoinase B